MFGKIVNWAPQEEVLAHPSTGCFVSHCGWNSVMEGISVGVPFLCWPCFADQLYAQTCICDAWKIGLKFEKDKDGLIVRQEIKTKITELFSSDSIKENALKLRDKARESVSEGGTSSRLIKSFIEQIKS
ncbi:UDP-glucuronosyl/UDP-glucosyltransferase [Dillenia turbinata]|uniref:UDP-glucuronosyl/UDP-glucosyltransferase n=1 Tax=Dillenia turbinata TaxID=194707 RepID=A0AAN8V3X1_9MAGN